MRSLFSSVAGYGSCSGRGGTFERRGNPHLLTPSVDLLTAMLVAVMDSAIKLFAVGKFAGIAPNSFSAASER